MAFYALYLWFKPWRVRSYPDMIWWYKNYVLKTKEQREAEERDNDKILCDCLRNLIWLSKKFNL